MDGVEASVGFACPAVGWRMRLLLVTSEPGWAEALRTLLSPADSVIPIEIGQAMQNPALAAASDACFVAEATMTPWTVDALKQLSSISDTPLFVATDAARSQWEEAAMFAGAQQIFRRPLHGNVVQLAITRCQRRRPSEAPMAGGSPEISPAQSNAASQATTLALWRDFSRLLPHATGGASFSAEYLAKLREVLQCGRLILYVADLTTTEHTFRCAAASGVDAAEYDAFQLNTRSGIAQLMVERGTMVWRKRLQPESGREGAAVRELAVFGAEIAVPISGRNGLAGLLLAGPRIAGGDYQEQELTLLYQALEAIGEIVAPRLGQRESSASSLAVLHAMPIAAAIVSANLRTVHVNAPFRSLIGRTEPSAITCDDMPAGWAAAITAAVQSRAASARVEVDHQLIGAPRKLRLSVRRIDPTEAAGDFLIALEDTTPAATAAQEADAHNMHTLLQRAGEQLSNEFRNALTPVDIMVQLSREATTSRAELERLSTQVSTAIHRLRRRIDDLAYLTKSAIIPEPTTVSSVLRFTRERLDDWLEDKHLKRVVWLNEFSETAMMADTRALALALAELVMNAVEASDGRPVTVAAEDGTDAVSFRVKNSGVWAPPPESSGFRHRPFVSAKSTGVGLGVEVASRVAENHGGRLALGPVSADTVEAILRVPRNLPAPSPVVETRIARVL